MRNEMRRLLKTTGGAGGFLLLLLARAPVDAMITLLNAVFLQSAFNAITQNDVVRLNFVCLMFGLASLAVFVYNGSVWTVYAPYTTRMEGRLRGKLFEKIASLPYKRIEAYPQGEWATRLNSDVQMPFSQPVHLPQAACAVVNIAMSAVILWRIHPKIFGLVLLFVIPHIVVSQGFIARAMAPLAKRSLEAKAANTGEFLSFIHCAEVARIYDAEDYLMKRLEQSSVRLRSANMRMHNRVALSAAILPVFGMGGYLTLLVVSSAWIASGALSFGDLTAAFQYRGGVLIGSIVLVNSMIAIKASIAGIQRINETMREQTEE